MKPNIVVVDGYTVNPGDLSWDALNQFGSINIYDRSSASMLIERCIDANIIISNKVVFTASIIDQLPQLQCICVSATGYNNVDLEAASRRKIPVCNVVGYSSPSVAQHVFAMILHFTNQLAMHANGVAQGEWSASIDWSYWKNPITELANKTIGIYGFGKIGQQVANIALALGMNLIAHHKHPIRDAKEGVQFVDLDTLFRESDFLSLHAPLTTENKGMISTKNLQLMKSSAILINTSRGGLINEVDLKEALDNKIIAGAGLDVLSQEPPLRDHPLIGVDNCVITPHQAWASKASRSRLIKGVIENVAAFVAGQPRNVVNTIIM